MSSKKQQIPAIRFNGFTDAWEQRKLGDLADIIGGGTPSTSNPEYWNGIIDWYSPVEIGEQIYVNGSQKTITELGLQKSSAKILPVGTVLFTSRAGIGNTAILAKEGATNQGFQSIVPNKNKLDSYFIFSRTHELKRYGETNGAGSTFIEVSGKQMANMPILIPQLEEQIKIGNFFKEIDNTIALHQRQLDNYKELKKAMLQRIFNRELRFKDKNGNEYTEWEYKKLVDMCDYMGDGDWIESKDQSNDGVRLIQTGNIGMGIYFDKFDKAKYITQETFERLKCTEVFEGDILVSRLPEPAGRACIVPKLPYKKLVTAVDCTIIRSNSITLNQYLLQCMSADKYFQQIQKEIAGGTRLRISRKNLEQIVFPAPCKEEQQQIANFLSVFDNIIEKIIQKTEFLVEQKKTFMQRMFI